MEICCEFTWNCSISVAEHLKNIDSYISPRILPSGRRVADEKGVLQSFEHVNIWTHRYLLEFVARRSIETPRSRTFLFWFPFLKALHAQPMSLAGRWVEFGIYSGLKVLGLGHSMIYSPSWHIQGPAALEVPTCHVVTYRARQDENPKKSTLQFLFCHVMVVMQSFSSHHFPSHLLFHISPTRVTSD